MGGLPLATWQGYLDANAGRFTDELRELLRIPSVSTSPEHREDVRRAAHWCAARLAAAGFPEARVFESAGHPLVYGHWLGAPGLPTVLIYGHFDVQPPEPLDLWRNPPFEPALRDGRIYARGASDMKGNLMVAIAACEAHLGTSGRLPLNVKFLLEGEEEVGSPSLPAFLREHRDLLAADLAVSADSGQAGEDQPMLLEGLRGLAGLQIDVRSAASDLHSGIMGGIAPNAVHALVEILASLRDPGGAVQVAGFYQDVQPLSPEERREMARIPDDTEAMLLAAGIRAAHGEPGYTPRERNWARPTLEVNGIWGGYQGDGVKTVIPCEAHAKITCRLVPDQTPARVLDLIERHVRDHAPGEVEVSVHPLPGQGLPYRIPGDHPGQGAAERALRAVYGKAPYRYRIGASVPVTALLHEILGMQTVAFGFSMFDEGMHAPNEFMRLRNFAKGQRAFCLLLEELARPDAPPASAGVPHSV